MYRYIVKEEMRGLWRYEIYKGYRLVLAGTEYFNSEMRATYAAMGHIVLLKNGDKAMRVWIVTRKVELDWDEIEAVFLHQSDAKQHILVLETDFPHEEFYLEGVRVEE